MAERPEEEEVNEGEPGRTGALEPEPRTSGGAHLEEPPDVEEPEREEVPDREEADGKSGAESDEADRDEEAGGEGDDLLEIAGRRFRSRLIVGTGKYDSSEVMVDTIRESGAEMVTVAVRRVDLDASDRDTILAHLDPDEFFLLANTAGCYSAEEAIRYARLARSAGFNEWLKLEVIGDRDTLMPDVSATVEAAEALTEEGFKVLAYTNDDIVAALRLEDAGCEAVMPLASPIGSGLGVVNPYYIREIKRRLQVPVIVDAGVGTASDACITMEQGVDGVLMNTALAKADDPVRMARAMRRAIRAGRDAFLAGRMPSREIAVPSTPFEGMLD